MSKKSQKHWHEHKQEHREHHRFGGGRPRIDDDKEWQRGRHRLFEDLDDGEPVAPHGYRSEPAQKYERFSPETEHPHP